MAPIKHVSRRAFITAASATLVGTALAAMPMLEAKAMQADPVFAAIAVYQAAYDRHIAACNAGDAAQAAFGIKSRECADAEAAVVTACDVDSEAWWDLVETHPTTLAGIIAYARFFAEHGETLHCEQSGADALAMVSEALNALGRSA